MEGSSAFVTKIKAVVTVQCPVWHCTATFQKVERLCGTVRSSLSIYPPGCGSEVIVCSEKLNLGPIICGVPLAVLLLLKFTVAPDK